MSHVFVVEDDPDISSIMVAALRDEGYSVRFARNGLEALDALRSQADDLPGVIFLDLMMPGMDGREFRVEQLKDPALSEIPVVLLTADPNAIRDALTMQVNGILGKPVTLDQVLRVVEQFCTRTTRRA